MRARDRLQSRGLQRAPNSGEILDDDRGADHRSAGQALPRSRKQQDAVSTERHRPRASRLGNLDLFFRYGATNRREELRFRREIVNGEPRARQGVRGIAVGEVRGTIRRRLTAS